MLETAQAQGIDQGVVPEHQLGVVAAFALRATGKEFEPAEEKGSFQQAKIVGQGRGVACVLKLAQHFGVGDDLGRKGRGQGKEVAQQRGLADSGQRCFLPALKATESESPVMPCPKSVFCTAPFDS